MNLYEIDAAIASLVDENGEISDFEALDELMMERDAKIENVACWYKNLMAEVKAFKEEEANLKGRRQISERKAERLLDYLDHALQGNKFSTAKVQVNYRKSNAVEVHDAEAAEAYLLGVGFSDCYTKNISLNKTNIGKHLKAGESIPGVEMVERMNLGVK